MSSKKSTRSRRELRSLRIQQIIFIALGDHRHPVDGSFADVLGAWLAAGRSAACAMILRLRAG